jgi:hypothetical protein
MSARVSRGERMLAKVGAKTGMTEKGRNWLIGALDPYHDTPLDVCGYPDGNKNPVCVQIVKQSFNLACPSAITTGTWDAQIISTPFCKPVRFSNASQMGGTNSNPTNTIYHNSTGSNVTIGGVTAISTATGNSFNPAINPPLTNTTNINSFGCPDQYLIGNARVIGKAFEVHNTTSELNLQGMCTTWTTPVGDYQTAGAYTSSLNTAGTFTQVGTVSTYTLPLWPNSQATAVLIPGSRQWTAKQGAYVVSRLETTNIPISEQGFAIQPFYDSGDVSTAINLGPVNSVGDGVSSTVTNWANVFWDSFDQRGALFSGLSLASTLTVNMTWIIERQPDPSLTDLVVLAVPPPERDNVALDLYTHISDYLPTAVPVAENGLGDWFMDAISDVADFVAPAISSLPGVGGLIGKGVSMLNTAYKNNKAKNAGAQQVSAALNKSPVYETNPYVKPPAQLTKTIPEYAFATNKHGKESAVLLGGNKKERVAMRQKLAMTAHRNKNVVARAKKAPVIVVNPFKGKSIPR